MDHRHKRSSQWPSISMESTVSPVSCIKHLLKGTETVLEDSIESSLTPQLAFYRYSTMQNWVFDPTEICKEMDVWYRNDSNDQWPANKWKLDFRFYHAYNYVHEKACHIGLSNEEQQGNTCTKTEIRTF